MSEVVGPDGSNGVLVRMVVQDALATGTVHGLTKSGVGTVRPPAQGLVTHVTNLVMRELHEDHGNDHLPRLVVPVHAGKELGHTRVVEVPLGGRVAPLVVLDGHLGLGVSRVAVFLHAGLGPRLHGHAPGQHATVV